ncbi:MAG: hypothetical protein HOV94_40355 [Saccharothrix sp.]|nr:hypothetical protein [Saccharothrix sp.]
MMPPTAGGADGWGVRTYFGMSGGRWDMVGDGNGSDGGCGWKTAADTVQWYRVCAGPDGADNVCRP